MRKVLSVLVCVLMICPAFATGDATPTSKGYVDAQMDTLQDNLPAAVANTVVTTTATAGETGTKAIYDASGNYAEQQNALVTAEDANTAIQMAINGELVCREYDPTGQYCYVYDVRPTIQNNILPTGYTALGYIESNRAQYIDTGILGQPGMSFEIDLAFTRIFDNAIYQMNGWWNDVQIGIKDETWWNYGKGVHTITPNTRYRTKLLINTNTASLYVDNILEHEHSLSTPHTQYPFGLFGLDNHNGTIIHGADEKIYFAKIYNSNHTLVRNFIPARRNSDDEVGMYDTVSNTFFTNAGTGTFVAGPDLNVYLPSGN